jgi:S-adenosylmethionine synthetase
MKEVIYSTESVTQGHPDKMADQISDAILDAVLSKDKDARIDCQTILSNGMCMIAGEMNTDSYVHLSNIIRTVIRNIGYTDASYGFDYRTVGVLNSITEQSPDINKAVNKSNGQIGAGDQAVVYGYAINESNNYIPEALNLTHKLSHRLSTVRKDGTLPFLRPDGKVLLNSIYEDNKIKSIDKVIISSQHSIDVPMNILKESIIDEVIKKTIPKGLISSNIEYIVNPAGQFVIGGPQANIGISGRKTIIDTYGGFCPNGDGVLSGQDATKIHRSGAYISRYIAKNIVASGICERFQLQLTYVISKSEPISMNINTFGTSKIDDEDIIKMIKKIFALNIKDIISYLKLDKPIYQQTATYGHFGNFLNDFSWEKIDKIDEIKDYFNI